MSRIDLKSRQFGEPRDSFHVRELQGWPKIACPVCTSKSLDVSENPFDDHCYCYHCHTNFIYGDSLNEQRDYVRLLLREFCDFNPDNLHVSKLLKAHKILQDILSRREDVDDYLLLAFTDQRLVYAYEKIEDFKEAYRFLEDELRALDKVTKLDHSIESRIVYAEKFRKRISLENYMGLKVDGQALQQAINLLEQTINSQSGSSFERAETVLKEKLELNLAFLYMELADLYQRENEKEKALEACLKMYQAGFVQNRNYRMLNEHYSNLLGKLKELIEELLVQKEENGESRRTLIIEMLEIYYEVWQERYELHHRTLMDFYYETYWDGLELYKLNDNEAALQILKKALPFGKKKIEAIKTTWDLSEREWILFPVRYQNFSILCWLIQEEKLGKELALQAIEILNLYIKLSSLERDHIQARGLQAFLYADQALDYKEDSENRRNALQQSLDLIEELLKLDLTDWQKESFLCLQSIDYYYLASSHLFAKQLEKADQIIQNRNASLKALEENTENIQYIEWAKKSELTPLFNDYINKLLRLACHYIL